jgi:hypothetical protein
MGRIFVQEIQRWQRQQARALGFEGVETAAVSFCQRFGSSLNPNIHWHVIVPDAFFVPDASGERVDTQKHRPPSPRSGRDCDGSGDTLRPLARKTRLDSR